MSYKLYSTPAAAVVSSSREENNTNSSTTDSFLTGSCGGSETLGDFMRALSSKPHTRKLGRVRNLGLPQRLGFSENKKPLEVPSASSRQSTERLKSCRRLEKIDSMDDSKELEETFMPLQTQKSPLREQKSSYKKIIESDEEDFPQLPTLSSSFTERFLRNKNIHPVQRQEQQEQQHKQQQQLQRQNPVIKIKDENVMENNKEHEDKEKNIIVVNGKRYVVLKVIGKGGSSKVYEAFDSEKQLRAIKRVDLSETDEATAAGYINEINLLRKLQNHGNRIVRMYDYEFRRSEDLLFVVMERGDTDLSTVLRSHITEAKIKFYWEEMLNVVSVIHEAGIIHSDLKPANFLLVAGTIKLIDFGIASSVQTDATSVFKDSQLGTFNFMSPEAIRDLSEEGASGPRIKISFKSDVWSLGCILYNMTYGKLPFGDQRNPLKKLQAILNPDHKIPFPDEGKDPLLVDSIKRCLERDVRKRASIRELLEHPYLTKSQGPESVDHLLSLLHSALTPNTREGIKRAKSKLANSRLNYE